MNKNSSTLQFLNIDVDVQSSEGAGALLIYFKERAVVLREDGVRFSFEHLNQHDTPDLCISSLISLIEGLPSDLADLWHRSEERCFDIGFEVGAETLPATAMLLSSDAVEALRDLGGEVRLSLYAAR